VMAGAASDAAVTRRQGHKWGVWVGTTLSEGKILTPGGISHATKGVGHPELAAERIVRFAERVGRENVIAGTDCGLGLRVHPQIAWAKLEALSAGAEIASRRLGY